MKIYIIVYPHRTEICDREKWELEKQACFKLGVPYVVKKFGVNRELIINPKKGVR